MRYEILEAVSSWELEIFVNKFLKMGWKLQGGIAVRPGYWGKHTSYKSDRYYQAVVRDS